MSTTPLGTLLTTIDQAVVAGMTTGVAGLTGYISTPAIASLGLYYLVEGIKIANGDGEPMQQFVPRVVRNIIILWLVTSSSVYNQYVTDFFFTSIPTAVGKVVSVQGGGALPAASVANGVTGTAAAFDKLTSIADQQGAKILQQASLLDVGARVGYIGYSLAIGLALLISAVVYEFARLTLALVLVLGIICIPCLIFEPTKGIFQNWLGKTISLVFMQISTVVLLQIMIGAMSDMMQKIVAMGGGLDDQVQGLLAMAILGIFVAMLAMGVAAVAYSIGSGIAVRAGLPLYFGARALGSALTALAGAGIAAPVMAGAGGLSLETAQAELAGGAVERMIAPDPAALPPPPLSLPGQ